MKVYFFITMRAGSRMLLSCSALLLLGSQLLIGCNSGIPQVTPVQDDLTPAEYLKWSVRMADSEISRHGDSLMYGGSNPKAKWTYTTGLFLKAVLDLGEAAGEADYEGYVRRMLDSFIGEDGEIKTYKPEEYNLDKINSGKVLLRLYQKSQDARYRKAADLLYAQLQKQPRTAEGGFWHKAIYPWQMWLDGVYMSGPFYAHYSLMFAKPAGFEDVVKQITLIDAQTRDPETGLRYHAWDSSNKQAWADPVTGCSPHFWGRAVGWYGMALVDVLDYLPEDLPARKQVLFILGDLLTAVVKFQDESGLWYQILDMPAEPGNYLETSCSAMFVYTLAKAVNHGYVAHEYAASARRGYAGLINRMLTTTESGMVNLQGVCSVAGLGGDPYRDGSFKYYISEPVVANDLKGVGPFIMAGIEMAKLSGLAESKLNP